MRILLVLGFGLFLIGCGNDVKFSQDHIDETSGRYLFNPEEVIDVRYDDNQLLIHWKGGDMKPVVLDENTFFVADMYKKLRFVQHPQTQERYLGIVSEADENEVEYAYPKVADNFKTPRMYLQDKDYKNAIAGYLELRKTDTTSTYIDEGKFNMLGYERLRENDYENAIAIFQMNVELFPTSSNVYDSLADAYLRSGDSAKAYENYQKAYTMNTGNERAKAFIEAYGNKGK